MGNYAFHFQSVGGHGCGRAEKEGDALAPPCGYDSCPDCFFRRVVRDAQAHGLISRENDGANASATFVHWPDSRSEVVDDFIAGVRKKGNF